MVNSLAENQRADLPTTNLGHLYVLFSFDAPSLERSVEGPHAAPIRENSPLLIIGQKSSRFLLNCSHGRQIIAAAVQMGLSLSLSLAWRQQKMTPRLATFQNSPSA